MKTWSLEDARSQLLDVAREALDHQPQRVAFGDGRSVVLVNGDDFAAMRFASELVDFIRRKMAPSDVDATPRRASLDDVAIDSGDRVGDA